MTEAAAAPSGVAAGAGVPAAGAIGFRRSVLHLGALWALAFAQPLFDLLGRNAEFFVARGSTAGDILLLAFGYALVPPLAGAALVWALGRIRPGAGWAAHLALVAALVTGLVLPPVGDVLGGSGLALAVAPALGALAALLYARAAPVRTFVGVLSPAPLVVLLLFLVVSPVRDLLMPGDATEAVAGPARSGVPIVHVVLDELPVTTLTDASGRIDPVLFPNLARFAAGATWYRRATTVDDLTTEAVPAQLTGEQPRAGNLPTARQHPRSLFSLFESSHDLIVVEPITDLCPERLCGSERPGTGDRLTALESDVEIVVQHLLLPEDLRTDLPAIDRVWEGFEEGSVDPGGLRGGAALKGDVLARLDADDAAAGFAKAIGALSRPRERPPLVFVHSTLPHGPWRHLPDGRQYPTRPAPYVGLDSKGWIGPQWQIDQNFGRHVLQVQYTDRLVGELLDALRANGLYDDAVIVVSADHGAAFRTGQPRRPANAVNAADIAGVPLLVKGPGQREGRVDDRSVRTIDVLPTIAEAAGTRIPWTTDGMPAGERPVDTSARIEVTHAGVDAVDLPLGELLAKRREREAVEARLLRAGPYAIGPAPELIGRRVTAGRPAAGAPRATIDGAADFADVDLADPVIPALVAGSVDGIGANAVLAIAVGGRIRATTRTFADGDRIAFSVIVPPAALRDGRNAVAVLQVEPGGELRPLGAPR